MAAASPRTELDRHYTELEARWSLVPRDDYGRLVIPTGNSAEPVHRWFHLKEAFSFQLLGRVAKDIGFDSGADLRILDCFSGAGTTAVSAILGSPGWSGKADAVGVELNPFLHFLASTKARVSCYQNRAALANSLDDAKAAVVSDFHSSRRVAAKLELPAQATLRNVQYFDPTAIQELRYIQTLVSRTACGLVGDIMKLVSVTSLEACGRLRRDGRALRFDPRRTPSDPIIEFCRRLDQVVADIRGLPATKGTAIVLQGDIRDDATELQDAAGGFDLAIFSPPYPNNIDYTEVYKTEAWMLDAFGTADEFRRHRFTTLRSHPSVTFPDQYAFANSAISDSVDRLLGPLLNAVPPVGGSSKERE